MLAAPALALGVPAAKRGYSLEELDRKIGREGKPTGLSKEDLWKNRAARSLSVIGLNSSSRTVTRR